MDLVSVILPYFKKKKFIEDSVNSALKQTYKNFEHIIILLSRGISIKSKYSI